jgi:hypothetical protein
VVDEHLSGKDQLKYLKYQRQYGAQQYHLDYMGQSHLHPMLEKRVEHFL